jgi:hypothetical protein
VCVCTLEETEVRETLIFYFFPVLCVCSPKRVAIGLDDAIVESTI